MKLKNAVFFLVVLLTHPFEIFSQGLTGDVKSITPPNAASLIKSVNYPVNEYNGTVDISVDVCTIKDGDIEIPLKLSYNSSGIKVSEEASWVGLGWSLSGSGIIVKQIMGEEDNYSSYHSVNTDYLFPSSPIERYAPATYYADTLYHYTVYRKAFEGVYKPDIYSYNFGGYSGRFYIDMRTEKAYQINPVTDIRFEKINISSGYENWKATTEDGASYYFTLVTTTTESLGGKIVERAFHLTELVKPNGQLVHYNYTQLGQSISTPYNSTSVEGKLTYFYTSDIKEIIAHNTSDAVVLNKIFTDNLDVDIYTSDRLDIDKEKKLDRIVIKDRNTLKTRTFLFNYDYFTSPIEGNYWTGNLNFFNLTRASKRLRLLSVKEEGLQPTIFDYSTTILPIKTSYAVDYWGYFNGKTTNNTLLPNLRQLQVVNSEIPESMMSYGACRATDISKCGACMLSGIQLPTGGKTTFHFEPNTFSNKFYPDVEWIEDNDAITGSINDTYINDQNHSTDVTSYCFDLTRTSEIRISRNMSRGLDNWSNLNGSYISIVKVDGSNVTHIERWILEYPMIRRYAGQNLLENEFQISYSGETPMIYTSEFIATLPAGRYCVNVYLPNNLGDQYGTGTNHSNVFAHIYVPEQSGSIPNKSYGAGLRIANIQYYDSNTTGASTFKGSVFYNYNDPVSGLSNGLLMSRLDYYRKYVNVRYLQGDTPSGCSSSPGCYVHEFMQNEYLYNGNMVIPMSFAAKGGLVGYSVVTKHYEDFGAVYTGTSSYLNGSVKSYFYNFPSSATYGVPDLPNSMNGELSKQEYLNSTGNLVKTINYFYDKHLVSNSFYGLHVDSYWYRNPSTVQNPLSNWPSCCGGMSLIIPEYFPGRYAGVFYPLRSEQFKMSKMITDWHNGLTNTIQYDYNEYGQLNKQTISDSKNIDEVTEYAYPSTYSGGDLTLSEMKNKHVWSTPICLVKKKSGNTTYSETNIFLKTGSVLTSYDGYYSVYMTNEKQIALTGTSVNKKIFYGYDLNRLRSINEEYNYTTVYLWGYNNTVPIAKIENATTNLVTTALGGTIPNFGNGSLGAYENTLRTSSLLNNSLITTYSYSPLYGVTSIKDSNGIITYYEYDNFGRLHLQKNDDVHITNRYKYNYKQ